MKSNICLIEKFALHDGPGIRTVVFFKGCPLKCLWCSNPETQKIENEIYCNRKKCIECQRCIGVCPQGAIIKDGIDYDKCSLCGKCIDTCPVKALSFVAREMTPEDVFSEVVKDIQFYSNSGGGVTVSGGEILMNVPFVLELFKLCKEEYINTAIETSGYGSYDKLLEVSKMTDYIMYDVKHMDSYQHKLLTGVGNELILNNLEQLSKVHNNIVIRIPLIKKINDTRENIARVIEFAKKKGIREIHLLPYHTLGLEKYRQLNKEYNMVETEGFSQEELISIKERMEQNNIVCKIRG